MTKTSWTEAEAGKVWIATIPGNEGTTVALAIESVGEQFKAFVNTRLVATRGSLPRAQNSARYYGTHMDQIRDIKERGPRATKPDRVVAPPPVADIIPAVPDGLDVPTAPIPLPPPALVRNGKKMEVIIPGVASDNGIVWGNFPSLTTEWKNTGTGRAVTIFGTEDVFTELHTHLVERLKLVTRDEFGAQTSDIRKAVKVAIQRLGEVLKVTTNIEPDANDESEDDQLGDSTTED